MLRNGVNVRYGDVLFKRVGAFNIFRLKHQLIRLGQHLGYGSAGFGGSQRSVHAAIYVGNGEVAESTGGEGVRIHALNDNYKWRVYHVQGHGEIGEMAADVAKQMAQAGEMYRGGRGDDPNITSFGDYDLGAATSSIFESSGVGTSRTKFGDVKGRVGSYLDYLWDPQHPKARKFFCSNFVVLAYSIASEAISNNPCLLIDRDYETVSPAELEETLKSDVRWNYLGDVRG